MILDYFALCEDAIIKMDFSKIYGDRRRKVQIKKIKKCKQIFVSKSLTSTQ